MNSPGFLILIVAFAALWFVLIRPQKRRQVEAARMLNSLNVGDEVLTAGGIYGEVTELQEEAVMVRIAPELESADVPPADHDSSTMTLMRRYRRANGRAV